LNGGVSLPNESELLAANLLKSALMAGSLHGKQTPFITPGILPSGIVCRE